MFEFAQFGCVLFTVIAMKLRCKIMDRNYSSSFMNRYLYFLSNLITILYLLNNLEMRSMGISFKKYVIFVYK